MRSFGSALVAFIVAGAGASDAGLASRASAQYAEARLYRRAGSRAHPPPRAGRRRRSDALNHPVRRRPCCSTGSGRRSAPMRRSFASFRGVATATMRCGREPCCRRTRSGSSASLATARLPCGCSRCSSREYPSSSLIPQVAGHVTRLNAADGTAPAVLKAIRREVSARRVAHHARVRTRSDLSRAAAGRTTSCVPGPAKHAGGRSAQGCIHRVPRRCGAAGANRAATTGQPDTRRVRPPERRSSQRVLALQPVPYRDRFRAGRRRARNRRSVRLQPYRYKRRQRLPAGTAASCADACRAPVDCRRQ